MNIILIGAPAAGKGSVAERLVEDYDFVSISSGALFRAEIASGSELGVKLNEIIKKGSLVSDELTFEFVSKRLDQDDCKTKGFILDGFPRNTNQARMLDEYLKKNNNSVSKVIYIEVEKDRVLERISSRRLCKECGAIFNTIIKPSTKGNRCDKCDGELYQRKDDSEEAVLNRLASFKNDTFPILNYYEEKGLVYKVDGNQSLEYTVEQVFKLIEGDK